MAKTTKTKIPKRIAGVKLPKELRKAGEAILETANSPQGREMLAAGLTMAAAAATAAVARRRAAAEETKPEGAAASASKPDAPNVQAIVDTVGVVADQIVGRFFNKRTKDA